jgi:hypothetical protein
MGAMLANAHRQSTLGVILIFECREGLLNTVEDEHDHQLD